MKDGLNVRFEVYPVIYQSYYLDNLNFMKQSKEIVARKCCLSVNKEEKQQASDIEGQSPAIILITMHFYCHPLRKAKWWGWLGCASNFIETSTLFSILLWTVFCTDSSPQLDCLFLYGFVLLAFNCPDNCPLDNWPPDNSNLGQIPPNNCHLGQLPPGNSHLRQLPLNNSLRQFPPRAIVLPPDNYIPTTTAWSNANYKLQFFHGYFLFPFHGPII